MRTRSKTRSVILSSFFTPIDRFGGTTPVFPSFNLGSTLKLVNKCSSLRQFPSHQKVNCILSVGDQIY